MEAATNARPVIIAGAGIAGLTAALAFASKGFPVKLFERAPALEEVGAGLQLSPNATRILDRLGVLARFRSKAVQPEAIELRRATDLTVIARMPLGAGAEARWGAPYLVAHRADLQAALLEQVATNPAIALRTGATVEGIAFTDSGITVSTPQENAAEQVQAALVVGADGVWSRLRGVIHPSGGSRFTGSVAWRAILPATPLRGAIPADRVSAFLHPRFHLIAYPVRAGSQINLVAFTKGGSLSRGWDNQADPAPLKDALEHAAPALARLVEGAAPWTAWPLHVVDRRSAWFDSRGMVLVGDAAHAMTPFAAQGAAIAIEDAAVLADQISGQPGDIAVALSRYDKLRRPRIKRVARRGAFNRFVWHAWGPIAMSRDLVLRLRSEERLMSDFDWLYGWDASAPRQIS